MFYTGVGSDKHPAWVKKSIKEIAEFLTSKGYTLRSGGPNGCDSVFEKYSINPIMFVPWLGYNGSKSKVSMLDDRGFSIAEEYHPEYSELSRNSMLIVSICSYKMLGENLDQKSDFLVFYGDDISVSQCTRIAEGYKIPTFNIGDYQQSQTLSEFKMFLKEIYKNKEEL